MELITSPLLSEVVPVLRSGREVSVSETTLVTMVASYSKTNKKTQNTKNVSKHMSVVT
jgi:hypothetical protein